MSGKLTMVILQQRIMWLLMVSFMKLTMYYARLEMGRRTVLDIGSETSAIVSERVIVFSVLILVVVAKKLKLLIAATA